MSYIQTAALLTTDFIKEKTKLFFQKCFFISFVLWAVRPHTCFSSVLWCNERLIFKPIKIIKIT